MTQVSASAPLFKPFRALGYITENTPFCVQRKGKEAFVTVSVGKAWQVFDCSNLRIRLVGPQLPGTIKALEASGDHTFAAVGNDVVVCRRVRRIAVLRGHTKPVLRLLSMGRHLVSLGADRKVCVWSLDALSEPAANGGKKAAGDADDGEGAAEARVSRGAKAGAAAARPALPIVLVTEPEREFFLDEAFHPTAMVHPETYVNKILIGSEDGRAQLWNFSTGKMLYEFSLGAAVRCMAPSPALDVIAFGLADGRAVLHDIKYDEKVMEFANAAGLGAGGGTDRLPGVGGSGVGTQGFGPGAAVGSAVTALSFRVGPGLPLLAAGGGAGVVTLWNLSERRLHTVIKDAHDGTLLSLHFFPGEPLLMSAGCDNAIRQWVLDNADGTARLLRFRSGHGAPPTCVRHYGPEGLRLLSAGYDRAFRVFSTIQDQQSREISQGHIKSRAKRLKVKDEELKLTPVVALDAAEVRERDWCNVVTAHEGDPNAYTWRLQNFSQGEHTLRPPRDPGDKTPDAPVTAVAVSTCGNYGIVGTASGRIDRYNLQSGMHRGAYHRRPGTKDRAEGLRPLAGREDPLGTAHRGPIVGLSSDTFNRTLVSAGSDGTVRVWSFKQRSMQRELPLGGGAVTHLAHHRAGSLVAAACADLGLRVVDVLLGRTVRRFQGHGDRITGLQFSADGKWLLSSSMDGTLRVWDVPSSRCLQAVRLGTPVTAFSLAPGNDMLATCHPEKRGIYLWSNQMIFGNPAAIMPSDRPVDCRLPPEAGKAGASDEWDAAGDAGSDSDMSDDDEDASDAARRGGEDADAPEPSSLARPDAAVDRTGTPTPLVPELVTLSLLPRSTWHSLVNLETIRARNRPIAAPKKDPARAPFFLSTIPSLRNQPTFDVSEYVEEEEAKRKQAEAEERERKKRVADSVPLVGWGGDSDDDFGLPEDEEGAASEEEAGEDEEGEEAGSGSESEGREASDEDASGSGSEDEEEEEECKGAAGTAGPRSRIVKGLRQPAPSAAPQADFLRLLEAGAEAGGDYTSLVALLRRMSPAQIDTEIRSLEVFPESASPEEFERLGLVMGFLESELAARRNFDLTNGFLRVFLEVHAEAIAADEGLRGQARRLHGLARGSWLRVDGLLQEVRSLVGFLGNLQAA